MANNYAPIDVSTDSALLKLAEEVYRTKRARVLRRANEDIAVIAPVQTVKRRSERKKSVEAEKYPTVASLAGAAGSLPTLVRWDEVRESARDEHLTAKFGTTT